MRWEFSNLFLRQLLSFGGTIVLIRLLRPEDFGLVAMVWAIMSFATNFVDMGFSRVIIQNRDLDETDLDSIAWVNIIVGALLTLIAWGAADAISRFYHAPMTKDITRWLSVVFLLIGCTVVPRSLMERKLDFRRKAYIESFSVMASSAVGIIAALAGMGVWALVMMILTNYALVAAGFLYTSERKWPALRFRFDTLKKTGRYTSSIFYSTLMHHLGSNLSRFLMGRYYGSANTGYYDKSITLSAWPGRIFSALTLSVLFSSLATIQEDVSRLRNAVLKSMRMIAVVHFPLMAGLMLTTKPLVVTVFGARWEGMTPYLRLIAAIALLGSFNTLLGSVFHARGLKRMIVRDATLRYGVMIALVAVGAAFGSLGIVWGAFFASVFGFFLTMHHLRLSAGISPANQLKNIRPAIYATLTMAAALLVINQFTRLSLPAALALNILAGGLIYFVALRIQRDKTIEEILDVLQSR